MASYSRLFLLILLSIIIDPIWSACMNETVAKCSLKQAQRIDLFASRLAIVGKRGRQLPTNNDELRKFCSETKNMTNTMEIYMKQCCDRDLINVAKIYIFSLRKNSKFLCNHSKRGNSSSNIKRVAKNVAKLFKVAPCLNKHIRNFRCLAEFKNQTKRILQYNDDGEKIRRGCCYYNDWSECEEQFVENLKCLPKDSVELQEFALDLLRSSRGDTHRFLCGDIEESSDQCDNLKQLDPNLFEEKPRIDSRLQSLVFIGLHILESISDSRF